MTAPPAVLGQSTSSSAFGPALTWRYLAPVGSILEIYPTAYVAINVGVSFPASRSGSR